MSKYATGNTQSCAEWRELFPESGCQCESCINSCFAAAVQGVFGGDGILICPACSDRLGVLNFLEHAVNHGFTFTESRPSGQCKAGTLYPLVKRIFAAKAKQEIDYAIKSAFVEKALSGELKP